MIRLAHRALLGLILAGGADLAGGAAPAVAQTAAEPSPRAEALNEQGKTLFSDQQDYAGAARRFREAIALSPDARYFYNLCAALEKLGQPDEALNACDEVFNHTPRSELAEKTGKKAAAIRQAMRQPTESTPAPTQPVPVPAPAQPTPAPAEQVAVEDPEAPGYRWSLGADLGVAHNSSVGLREYGRTGIVVEVHGGLMVSPRLRVGALLYLNLATFGERSEVAVSQPLSIASLGAAVTWHKQLWRSLHLTPLAGLQISALSVGTRDGLQSYGTGGVRLEAALEWRLPGGHHVLHVTPLSLVHIFPAGGQISGQRNPARDYGLDREGSIWSFTVGYSYRFEGGPFPGWTLE